MKLLQFELKKILRRKRFFLLLILVISCIGILFLRNQFFQSAIEKERNQQLSSYLQEAQQLSNQYQIMLNRNPNDEESKAKSIMINTIISSLNGVRTAINADNWQKQLQEENHFLSQLLDYKAAGGDYSLKNEDIRRQLVLNTQHLAVNIPPEHETYSITLPNFLKQVVDVFVNFSAIIVLLLVIGNIVTSEFKKRSILLLFTQPIKKNTIVHSKFWSAIIVYFIFTLITLAASIGISIPFGKPGTFDYPILIEQNEGFSFLTIQEYILVALVSATIMALLTITLFLLISLIFKRTIVSVLFVFLLLIGGQVLIDQVTIPFMNNWLNPFQYVLVKETIVTVGYDWYQGIAITISLAILCYVLAIWRIRTIRIQL